MKKPVKVFVIGSKLHFSGVEVMRVDLVLAKSKEDAVEAIRKRLGIQSIRPFLCWEPSESMEVATVRRFILRLRREPDFVNLMDDMLGTFLERVIRTPVPR